MTNTPHAFAFLFNSSHPTAPSWYGGRFDPAFLAAMKAADPSSMSESWLLRGDLLLHNLATRITSVRNDERGQSHTVGYNSASIKTVVFDFLEWTKEPPNRFDHRKIEAALTRMHIAHCITAVSLTMDVAAAIDTGLRSDNLYLGMAAIDLGNPVMVTLLINYLVRDSGVSGGQIWMEADYVGDVHSVFEGAERYSPDGIGILSAGGLREKFGAFPVAELSATGRLAVSRHEKKSQLTLQERVLASLSREWEIRGKGPFRFDRLDNENMFEATVPPPKLTHYALNPNHPDGAGKAKFFSDVLDIRQGDWRFLYAQIQEEILTADLTDFWIKRWSSGIGVSFNAILPVAGRNGRIANIFTNWIMEPGKTPSLSTIRPDDESERPTTAIQPPLVGEGLIGIQKWQSLYHLADFAGMAAHDSTVPTPLFIQGYQAHGDGECGFAFVHVPDARRDFARWLLKTGRAQKGYRGGATISCPRGGQSVDRAYAYAMAFARVLNYNGVACSTEKLLD